MPYREAGEVPDDTPRAGRCPSCRTELLFSAGERISVCDACDARFATSAANPPPAASVPEIRAKFEQLVDYLVENRWLVLIVIVCTVMAILESLRR